MAVDVQPEDRLGVLRGLVRRVCELDPARLPSAPGQHLGLDDDLAADLLGGGSGLLRGRGDTPLRDRDPEALEEFLSLVLVEVHRRGDSSLGAGPSASDASGALESGFTDEGGPVSEQETTLQDDEIQSESTESPGTEEGDSDGMDSGGGGGSDSDGTDSDSDGTDS